MVLRVLGNYAVTAISAAGTVGPEPERAGRARGIDAPGTRGTDAAEQTLCHRRCGAADCLYRSSRGRGGGYAAGGTLRLCGCAGKLAGVGRPVATPREQ